MIDANVQPMRIFSKIIIIGVRPDGQNSRDPQVVVIAEPGSIPDEMPLVIITDLDHSSKVQPGGDAWKAILKRGALLHKDGKFSMRWDGQDEMQSGHAEAGRGMELSELQFFSNRLFAFDDRSGMVFEVLDYKSNSPKQPRVVPRHILMEGDGDTDKGFKIEWATVKVRRRQSMLNCSRNRRARCAASPLQVDRWFSRFRVLLAARRTGR